MNQFLEAGLTLGLAGTYLIRIGFQVCDTITVQRLQRITIGTLYSRLVH